MFILNYPCPKAVLSRRNKYIIRELIQMPSSNIFLLQTMPAPETHYKQLRLWIFSLQNKNVRMSKVTHCKKAFTDFFKNAHQSVIKMSLRPKPHGKLGVILWKYSPFNQWQVNDRHPVRSTSVWIVAERSREFSCKGERWQRLPAIRSSLFIQRYPQQALHRMSTSYSFHRFW